MAGLVVHVGLKSRTVIRSLRARGLVRELRVDTARTRAGIAGRQQTWSARRPPTRRSPGAARWPSPGPARCCCWPCRSGQSLGGPLRRTALLAPHGQDLGGGPNDFQINQTAAEVGIRAAETGASWRLTLDQAERTGQAPVRLSRAELLGLEQHAAHLPIACVEGWSTDDQAWTGVRLRDLARLAGVSHPASVLVESLERGGTFRHAALSAGQIMDPDSLLALRVNGADLSLDHGYPARVIVPANPGVHNTKWVASLTFAS